MIDRPARHWFIDHLGRGYYIHDSDGPLRLFRREQSWTYAEPAFVGELAEGETPQAVLQTRPLEAMLDRLTPTTADYTTAYIEHEREAEHPRCGFSVLVDADTDDMRAFARAMRSDEPPVDYHAGDRVHTYLDCVAGLRGTVFFEAVNPGDGSVLDTLHPGLIDIAGVGRPCILLTKREGPALRIAVASTDLDDEQPLALLIRDHWEGPPGLPEGITVEYDDATKLTTVTIPYRDQTQVDFVIGRP